jgi:hypothetical protein
MKNTLDIKEIYARDYLLAKWYALLKDMDLIERLMFKYTKITKILVIGWLSYIVWILCIWLTIWSVSAQYNEFWDRDYERDQRIEACTVVYMANKAFVDKTYIHKDQDVITRCTTMMWLIGAFESSYFTSRRCIEDNSCYWIKDWNTWKFKIYKSRFAGKLDFADKYLVGNWDDTFKWHKNKNIEQFVYNWSHTDRVVYTKFVKDRYWNMYNSMKDLKFVIN